MPGKSRSVKFKNRSILAALGLLDSSLDGPYCTSERDPSGSCRCRTACGISWKYDCVWIAPSLGMLNVPYGILHTFPEQIVST